LHDAHDPLGQGDITSLYGISNVWFTKRFSRIVIDGDGGSSGEAVIMLEQNLWVIISSLTRTLVYRFSSIFLSLRSRCKENGADPLALISVTGLLMI
jgi:hypothetical protein